MVGYAFFLLAALITCALLGNPYSGLFRPDRVIEQDALPWHYAMGTKVIMFLVLGWLFTLLGQRERAKAQRPHSNA